MTRSQLAKSIYQTAHLTGNFVLRSGQISAEYFDKYLFESDPKLLAAIASHLAKMIPTATEVLAGLETGGIPLATALSLQTGLPVVFVRKEAKSYGTAKLAEGISVADKRVLVIEDVVTTGGQIIISVTELRKLAAKITKVLCVIERDPQARKNLASNDLNLISLFTMQELKSGT